MKTSCRYTFFPLNKT